MSIIALDHVSKCFQLRLDHPRSFQDLVLGLLSRRSRRSTETLWALKDVSFSIEAGETVGLIGANGSGKSTCLKLMTRILEPTSGQLSVEGRVSALLELGAGFHPELTGRENVLLQGSVMGLGRREMLSRLDQIVAFSELERFIDVPVKVYSSGMYVRLAFATAIHVEPDILLVDEVLAVGDGSFQQKCLERIYALKARGVTIVLVSHDLDAVRDVCDRVIWFDQGTLCDEGLAEPVVARYLQHAYERERAASPRSAQEDARSASPEAPPGGSSTGPEAAPRDDEAGVETAPGPRMTFRRERWGSGEMTIEGVDFLDRLGRRCQVLTAGEPMTIAIHYAAKEPIEDPVFGVAFFRNDGLHLSGGNTHLSGLALGTVRGRGEVRYTIPLLCFLAGSYYLTVAVHSRDESRVYDYQSLGYEFRVRLGAIRERYGTVYVPAHWDHQPGKAEASHGSQEESPA